VPDTQTAATQGTAAKRIPAPKGPRQLLPADAKFVTPSYPRPSFKLGRLTCHKDVVVAEAVRRKWLFLDCSIRAVCSQFAARPFGLLSPRVAGYGQSRNQGRCPIDPHVRAPTTTIPATAAGTTRSRFRARMRSFPVPSTTRTHFATAAGTEAIVETAFCEYWQCHCCTGRENSFIAFSIAFIGARRSALFR